MQLNLRGALKSPDEARRPIVSPNSQGYKPFRITEVLPASSSSNKVVYYQAPTLHEKPIQPLATTTAPTTTASPIGNSYNTGMSSTSSSTTFAEEQLEFAKENPSLLEPLLPHPSQGQETLTSSNSPPTYSTFTTTTPVSSTLDEKLFESRAEQFDQTPILPREPGPVDQPPNETPAQAEGKILPQVDVATFDQTTPKAGESFPESSWSSSLPLVSQRERPQPEFKQDVLDYQAPILQRGPGPVDLPPNETPAQAEDKILPQVDVATFDQAPVSSTKQEKSFSSSESPKSFGERKAMPVESYSAPSSPSRTIHRKVLNLLGKRKVLPSEARKMEQESWEESVAPSITFVLTLAPIRTEESIEPSSSELQAIKPKHQMRRSSHPSVHPIRKKFIEPMLRAEREEEERTANLARLKTESQSSVLSQSSTSTTSERSESLSDYIQQPWFTPVQPTSLQQREAPPSPTLESFVNETDNASMVLPEEKSTPLLPEVPEQPIAPTTTTTAPIEITSSSLQPATSLTESQNRFGIYSLPAQESVVPIKRNSIFQIPSTTGSSTALGPSIETSHQFPPVFVAPTQSQAEIVSIAESLAKDVPPIVEAPSSSAPALISVIPSDDTNLPSATAAPDIETGLRGASVSETTPSISGAAVVDTTTKQLDLSQSSLEAPSLTEEPISSRMTSFVIPTGLETGTREFTKMEQRDQYDVIIVGGGLSGLAAAYKLTSMTDIGITPKLCGYLLNIRPYGS